MPGPEETLFPKIQGRPTDIYIETPRSQVIGETSRYDPNYYIPIGGLTAQEIQGARAKNQGLAMELGTAAANLVPNIALSTIESFAQLGDLEDWSNMIQGNAANYGNAITRWANKNKNAFGEIYQETPGENNIYDSAWWVSNGAGLVESVVAFGLTGYGVGSVFSKGALALSKSLNIYGKAKMGIDLAAKLGTSGTLAFTEGAMTGAQVFKETFPEVKDAKYKEIIQKGIQQYGEENLTEDYLNYADKASTEYANQIAGESATKAVRINTAINTFLNIPETGALFRSMSSTRYLDDVLKRTKGENIDNYIERIKSFDVNKHLTREGIKSKVKTTGGETLEEMVNVYAEQEGKNVKREALGQDIVTLSDMLADDDIWAAGFWGAIGGSMQGFVMNKMPKWVTQEDGTTKRTTVGAYNKEQVTKKYEEQIGDLTDRLTEFNTARTNLETAAKNNDEKLYNESLNTIFKYNSFNSIVKGVEEQLIEDYQNIMSLTPEQAIQQGFKNDYKEDAAKKIQEIKANTAEWNKIQDIYMSQDLDLAGYPETIFQQYINVQNNKKIISEQEFEINKLQADINNSYRLKGTDLTVAAYNDIVSSIRALDNDFELETVDLENLMNLNTFDKKTQKRIIAKLNNKYGNLQNAKTQIEKNLDNLRDKANNLANTFKLQRENFDLQVDPENKLSQEEKDEMFSRMLVENEFEINALTESKAQLERNRETLRSQEEELRKLRSKEGVEKFKELKRQKLAEQTEATQVENEEIQQQQQQAEREAQREVLNDIRTREEENPETVSLEELEEADRLEEELSTKVEGETYTEGEYYGEGSTKDQLDKQYDDIVNKANNTDEKGRVLDQQGKVVFVDDKLVFSFDKIAYASTIEYSEDEVTGKIKHTSLSLNPETNPDFLTTKFMPGTPIKLKKLTADEFKLKPFKAKKEITFIDELGRKVLVASAGEEVTFDKLTHPYMQPIGIYDQNENLIGMLHDVTYVRPQRVLEQSLEDDRANLISIRSKIGDSFIDTVITGKTNGHINTLTNFEKLSTLIPGPIEFAIATSTLQLNTSKIASVDGLINKSDFKVGQVYAITYTPNGDKVAIPVKTTQVKEHPQLLASLLSTLDSFLDGKISKDQLKEEFSKYIYSTPSSQKLDASQRNFNSEENERFYIDFDSLNVDGVIFGKSGDTKRFLSTKTPKEDVENLRKIFINILSNVYINMNYTNIKNDNFAKEYLTSNVRFYPLPDGRVTVFDNPVLSISTAFAGEVKPIEKTEEQPRVAPEPVVEVSETREEEIRKRGLDRLFPIDIDETTPEGKQLAKEKLEQEEAIKKLDQELAEAKKTETKEEYIQRRKTEIFNQLKSKYPTLITGDTINPMMVQDKYMTAEDIEAAQKVLDPKILELEYDAELEGLEGKEEVEEIISDETYNNFIDNNIVPDDILNSIADKVINKTPLSERETSIFTGKTSEINSIIVEKSTLPTTTIESNNGLSFDVNDIFIEGDDYSVMVEEVKPGVSELFESNPELANQVYEALGFNTTSITPQQKQQAQQLYSQYLESLNKPNTNPILQGNQKEQVKKFSELQERLNNKEFLEGAKNAYESTPELQQFGTQEQYNDYIARVSLGIIKNPSSGEYNYTSKVKDIVYHGTDAKFDKFDKSKPSKTLFSDGTLTQKAVIYFTKNKEIGTNLNEKPKVVLSAILNIKEFVTVIGKRLEDKISRQIAGLDTKITEAGLSKNKELYDKLVKEKKDLQIKQSNLSIYVGDITEENFTKIKKEYPEIDSIVWGQNELIVFEPEQIHILGSKQDIEGFKEFVTKGKEIKKSLSLQDKVNNLINEGKITKFCK